MNTLQARALLAGVPPAAAAAAAASTVAFHSRDRREAIEH
jgi:hypothetical protein